MSLIVGPIRERLMNSDRRKPASGNVTGSRLGNCTAQLQLLRAPSLSQPEKPNPRALLTWMQGDRIEEWLGDVLYDLYPGVVGLEQEPFYFSVPVPDDQAVATIAGHMARQYGEDLALWGRVVDGFQPPTMRIGDDGRIKLRPLANKRLGLVLDTKARLLWIPTMIDFALRHPDYGLTVVECKAVSDYAFRRLAAGKLDYQKACQLVGESEATKANVLLFAYRNETGHIAEIAYLRDGAKQIRVQLTAPNGSAEVYFVKGDRLAMARASADEPETLVDFPSDAQYDAAEVWTPWDPRYLADIKDRILRTLLWTPDQPVYREYGPTFTCEKCRGEGTHVCGQCKGAGVTPKLKKPCGPCQGAKTVACTECDGRGFHPEVELPAFPCGYCPVIGACYGQAGLRLEIGRKPIYYVTAEAYQAAKLEYHPPTDYTVETPEAEPAEPTEVAAFALEAQEATV